MFQWPGPYVDVHDHSCWAIGTRAEDTERTSTARGPARPEITHGASRVDDDGSGGPAEQHHPCAARDRLRSALSGRAPQRHDPSRSHMAELHSDVHDPAGAIGVPDHRRRELPVMHARPPEAKPSGLPDEPPGAAAPTGPVSSDAGPTEQVGPDPHCDHRARDREIASNVTRCDDSLPQCRAVGTRYARTICQASRMRLVRRTRLGTVSKNGPLGELVTVAANPPQPRRRTGIRRRRVDVLPFRRGRERCGRPRGTTTGRVAP